MSSAYTSHMLYMRTCNTYFKKISSVSGPIGPFLDTPESYQRRVLETWFIKGLWKNPEVKSAMANRAGRIQLSVLSSLSCWIFATLHSR